MIELLMPQILYHLGCTEILCVNTNIGTNYHSQLIIDVFQPSNSICRPFNILKYCRLALFLSPRVKHESLIPGWSAAAHMFFEPDLPWTLTNIIGLSWKKVGYDFQNCPFLGVKLRDTQNWIAYMYVHIVHVHSKYIQSNISMGIHII